MNSCNSEERISTNLDLNALLSDYFLAKSEQFELVYQCKARLHGLDLCYS